jgi:hypothetical protein
VAGRGQVQSHLLHQHIRRRGQQHPERVRQKVRATGPADLHAVVQFFDPIFYVAPLTVSLLVNPLRALFKVGDHEARVVFRFLVRGGFVDDASFPRPSLACSVLALAIDMFGLAGGLRRTHFRFAIQKIQNFRGREAAVEAHPDFRFGKGVDT